MHTQPLLQHDVADIGRWIDEEGRELKEAIESRAPAADILSELFDVFGFLNVPQLAARTARTSALRARVLRLAQHAIGRIRRARLVPGPDAVRHAMGAWRAKQLARKRTVNEVHLRAACEAILAHDAGFYYSARRALRPRIWVYQRRTGRVTATPATGHYNRRPR